MRQLEILLLIAVIVLPLLLLTIYFRDDIKQWSKDNITQNISSPDAQYNCVWVDEKNKHVTFVHSVWCNSRDEAIKFTTDNNIQWNNILIWSVGDKDPFFETPIK